jgi:hypothetical protein
LTSASSTGEVLFYYPTHPVGGVVMLFSRVARWLAEQSGVRAGVIDYADGLLARQAGERVDHVTFTPGERAPIPAGATIVTPLSHLYSIHKHLAVPRDTRIVCWVLHPFEVKAFFPRAVFLRHRRAEWTRSYVRLCFGPERRAVARALRYLHEHVGLYFMDMSVWKATSIIIGGRDFETPVMLPICSPERAPPALPRKALEPDVLDVAWLGRTEDQKINSIVRIAKDAVGHAAKTGQRVRFHVIGDGTDLAYLQATMPRGPGFEAVYTGVLVGPALDEYLWRSVDILIAQGTACLDGASLGLPTAIIDASHQEIGPDFNYRWLFEADGLDLGIPTSTLGARSNPHAFSDLADAVRSGGRAVADDCQRHYRERFTLESCGKRLFELIGKNTTTYGEMIDGGLFQPSLKQKVWRLSRELLGRVDTGPGN